MINQPCKTCKHAYHSTLTHFVECKLSGLVYIESVKGNCENYGDIAELQRLRYTLHKIKGGYS